MTRIAVVICSVGRPDCLGELVPALASQTRPADRVLFVVTKPEDIGFDPAGLFGDTTKAETVIAPKGLPRQRNAGLDAIAGDCDFVVFFDDDFVPSRDALAGIIDGFARWPEVNGMTGVVIADGINTKGYSDQEAKAMVADWDNAHTLVSQGREPVVTKRGMAGLYGCNMAYRMAAIADVRFDENLPLYGWQEDIDFAARVPGDRVRTDAFVGVHRGAKTGRETAGRRLGYSQIANPWYMWRKGSMTFKYAARLACRNLAANHAKVLRPEPWINRRARVSGNWLAILDLMLGRADPRRILDL